MKATPAQSTSPQQTSEFPRDIDYTLLKRDHGRLDSTSEIPTGITGYAGIIPSPIIDGCSLRPDGMLMVFKGFEWDFGSGPAVNTPPMVLSSLAHDALCRLCNRRIVPWRVRKEADKLFYEMLRFHGTTRIHARLRYWAVRAYSMTLAKWRDRERLA